MQEGRLRLHQILEFQDIPWKRVVDSLSTRHLTSLSEAEKLVAQFRNSVVLTLNPYWIGKRQLSGSENRVVIAICDLVGADVISIHIEKALGPGWLSFHTQSDFTFKPEFRPDSGHAQIGEVKHLSRVFILFFERRVESRADYFLLHALLGCFGLISTVLGLGLFLYGLSVGTLFVVEPYMTTVTATQHAPIGLALLCSLVGAGALLGRAARNLIRIGFQSLRDRIANLYSSGSEPSKRSSPVL